MEQEKEKINQKKAKFTAPYYPTIQANLIWCDGFISRCLEGGLGRILCVP
jgi:hypothetical protein